MEDTTFYPEETTERESKTSKSFMEALIGKPFHPWYKKGGDIFTAFWWLNTCALFWALVLGYASGPALWVLLAFVAFWASFVTYTVAALEDA